MKIRLKNFRCYTDKEFDFGEDGLSLLSGQSGSGKSTIMMGITFALYGTGTKLCTFGKTSMKVELEFQKLHITRTKKPNRLVVKDTSIDEEYEDESAQNIIYEKFGKTFDITSYLQQNGYGSFITMSPVEKLAFLERFAFIGIDLGKIKGKCQTIIKKRNEELISATSQLQMITEHLETLEKPQKNSFPFKTKNKEKFINNEKIRLKNSQTGIKKTLKKLELLKREFTDTKILKTQIEAKKDIIREKRKKIDELGKQKEEIDFKGEEYLENLQKILKEYIAEKEYHLLGKKIENDSKQLTLMEKTETENHNKLLENIKNTLWKEYGKEEINNSIKEYTELYEECETLTKLQAEREKLGEVSEDDLNTLKKSAGLMSSELKTLNERYQVLSIQKEVYSCPKCHTNLKLSDSGLQIFNGNLIDTNTDIQDVEQKIKKLSESISKLEKDILNREKKLEKINSLDSEISLIRDKYETEIPNINEVSETLEYMKEYKRTQIDLEKKLKLTPQFSGSLEVFRKGIEKDKEKMEKLAKKIVNKHREINEEELRETISSQKRASEKLSQILNDIQSLEREIGENQNEIDIFLEKFYITYKESREIGDIEGDISEYDTKLKEYGKNEREHSLNLEKIEEYLKIREKNDQYKEWQDKAEKLGELEKKCRDKYSASTLLKEKILQAESIAILNVINSINLHAQEYLDLFFPNDPIIVRLSPFKETKKSSKPQINIEIDYKGMEADINMLSGGEMARVVLAYTLALSEIFNSPLIMLDECTASLDGDTTSIVMEGIKKNFSHKLVIVIAHQVIEGDFDRKISL